MSLCHHCSAIDIGALSFTGDSRDDKPHHRTFRELKKSAEFCPLCALFVEGLEKIDREYDYDQAYEPGDPRGIYYSGQHEIYKKGISRIEKNDPKFLIGLTMMCQGGMATVDLYASEDSVAATAQDISGRPIRPAEHSRVAQRWIQHCLAYHTRCASRVLNSQNSSIKSDWLPKRVIDVGPVDGPRDPFLLCDSELVGEYVTLSHCWGNGVSIKTTTENLPAYQEKIPLDELTRTFRDAVMITRNLGFSYLWIDSLCIIQNDGKDWEIESALMANIYGNSAVTIAASSAENSQVGCLFPRDATPRIVLNYPSHAMPTGFVCIRRPLNSFEKTVDLGPLNRRAWVFQERLLSRRILYYGKDQLHWECQETCLSEDGHHPFGNHYDKSTSILSSAAISASHQVEMDTLYMDWYEMVEKYTQRNLTRESDKFPALSGLVSVVARLSGDRYVAGLWERDLMVGLLWHASFSERPRLERPTAYRAPSWSWATLNGGISFDSSINHKRQRSPSDSSHIYALSDLHITIELTGSDPFGMVASGNMTVSGRLKQVEYKIVSESLENYYSPLPSMNDILYSDGEEIGSAYFDEAGVHGPLYCLEVCSNPAEQLALILKPIGGNEKYCRVGTATLLPPLGPAHRRDWFHDVPKKHITIF